MSKRTKGILCIIASAFCFALMSTFVRLSGDLPSVQKSFFRNFVAMFIALAVLLKEGGGLKLQKGCLPLHLLRSIAGTLGILGNFYAVDHLVLSNASMLNKMSPFFVLVFSYFILKEKLKPTQVVIVAVAFLGSLFIIKPVPTNLDVIPSLAGFFGGLCAGGFSAGGFCAFGGICATYICFARICFARICAADICAKRIGGSARRGGGGGRERRGGKGLFRVHGDMIPKSRMRRKGKMRF